MIRATFISVFLALASLLVAQEDLPEVSDEGVYRAAFYRGRSQSMLIDAAERARAMHIDFKMMPDDIGLDELQAQVGQWMTSIDSISVITADAMKVSHNPGECQSRISRAERGLLDMKEFMPFLFENESVLDYKQKLMALAFGAGEASVDLFYASTITHDDLPSDGGGTKEVSQEELDRLAEKASRAELDEAALDLLKEAYERDLEAQAAGKDGEYLDEGEETRVDAAVERITELQDGMEEDILRLMDALTPEDPLADNEVELSSDGDIIFDPDVEQELIYRIQIGYFKSNRDPEHFHGLHPVYAFTTEEGYAKFYTGQYRSYRSAVMIKNYIKDNFIPDAFVVPFIGTERVGISEAIFKELEVLGD